MTESLFRGWTGLVRMLKPNFQCVEWLLSTRLDPTMLEFFLGKLSKRSRVLHTGDTRRVPLTGNGRGPRHWPEQNFPGNWWAPFTQWGPHCPHYTAPYRLTAVSWHNTHNSLPHTWHTTCYYACPVVDIRHSLKLVWCSLVPTLTHSSVPRY